MELVKISENDKMTIYIDIESIEKNGYIFEYLEVLDYKYPESVHKDNKSSSCIFHSVINSETHEQTILQVREFSGHMGTGEILNEGNFKENIRVIPSESLSYQTLMFLNNLREH